MTENSVENTSNASISENIWPQNYVLLLCSSSSVISGSSPELNLESHQTYEYILQPLGEYRRLIEMRSFRKVHL